MPDKTGYGSSTEGDCCQRQTAIDQACCWKSDGMGNSSAVLGIFRMTTGFSFLWMFSEVFVTGVCV